MRFIISLLVSVLMIIHAMYAHEMWLMPTKFKLQPNDSMRVSMNVGMNFSGELWNYEPDKLITMRRISQGKMLVMDKAIPMGKTPGIRLGAGDEGTSLIIFASKPKFIELTGKEFNQYLKDEGIEDILELRTKRKELNKSGRELYARCAKTILQTGVLTDDIGQTATGMEYELIP
jgi:hypothetical protein